MAIAYVQFASAQHYSAQYFLGTLEFYEALNYPWLVYVAGPAWACHIFRILLPRSELLCHCSFNDYHPHAVSGHFKSSVVWVSTNRGVKAKFVSWVHKTMTTTVFKAVCHLLHMLKIYMWSVCSALLTCVFYSDWLKENLWKVHLIVSIRFPSVKLFLFHYIIFFAWGV